MKIDLLPPKQHLPSPESLSRLAPNSFHPQFRKPVIRNILALSFREHSVPNYIEIGFG